MSPPQSRYNLLIATVGGNPEPLIASITHWRPKRIVFVPSHNTKSQISDIQDRLIKEDYDLDEGRYNTVLLSDPQSFSQCVQEMRSGLEQQVIQWHERGERFDCIVDFTGGTKCMSAALALVARPWRYSRFSYVGGVERDRNSVGIVVSGREQVVHDANPWNALGYQIVEDAVAAFDRHAFGEGVQQLRNALKHVLDNSSRKAELNALAMFMEAYDLWSRSEYRQAHAKFIDCEKRLNDLTAALCPIAQDQLRKYIDQAKRRLETLKQGTNHPTQALLEDLISDSARRRREGRYVDAVARLYRAVEVAAQLRLWQEYEISTSMVSLEKLPQPMRDRLRCRSEHGKLKLALQDSFDLLKHWKDPLGERFAALGWDDKTSPLTRRNDSIAGHGFAPVSSETSDELWNGVLSLTGLSDDDIFRFPQLGQRAHENEEQR